MSSHEKAYDFYYRCLRGGCTAQAQELRVNRQEFFLDDRVIETTLTTDIKGLRNDKKSLAWMPGNIVMKFSDTSVISSEIELRPRGIYRKNYCDLASLMLNFKLNHLQNFLLLKN